MTLGMLLILNDCR